MGSPRMPAAHPMTDPCMTAIRMRKQSRIGTSVRLVPLSPEAEGRSWHALCFTYMALSAAMRESAGRGGTGLATARAEVAGGRMSGDVRPLFLPVVCPDRTPAVFASVLIDGSGGPAAQDSPHNPLTSLSTAAPEGIGGRAHASAKRTLKQGAAAACGRGSEMVRGNARGAGAKEGADARRGAEQGGSGIPRRGRQCLAGTCLRESARPGCRPGHAVMDGPAVSVTTVFCHSRAVRRSLRRNATHPVKRG